MPYNRIPDEQIPSASPEAVIRQCEPFVRKLVKRYWRCLELTTVVDRDDLIQAGMISIMEAQKTYKPDTEKPFIGWVAFYIQNAIRKELRLRNGKMKDPVFIRLDEPLTDDSEETRLDILEDPNGVPVDTNLLDDENHREAAEAVHAAICRMKSDKQREVIQRVHLDGQGKEQAAAEMGIKKTALYALENAGCSTLRRDHKLQEFVMNMPSFRVGLNSFQSTWTSAVEAEVIWKDEHRRQLMEISTMYGLPSSTGRTKARGGNYDKL